MRFNAMKNQNVSTNTIRKREMFEVGALLRNDIRRFLDHVTFHFPSFTWEEKKYFLTSSFIVEGDKPVVDLVRKKLSEAYGD